LLAQYGGAKSNIGVQDVPKPHVLSSPREAQSDTQQPVQVTGAQNNALLGTDMAPQIPGQESTEQR
jgi:nitrous oxide reductase accessory protein NosL